MSQISRPTIDLAIDLWNFSRYEHDRLDQFLWRFGLENVAPRTEDFSIYPRITKLKVYLYSHLDEIGPSGANLVFEIIEYITTAHSSDPERFRLENSLKADGYGLSNDGHLEPMLPESIQLAEKRDEFHSLLDKFRFDTAKGHLDEAMSCFTRGEWAAANSQLRTFIESLFNSIADRLVVNSPQKSHDKWRTLSQLNPPFFSPELNEWRKTDPNDKSQTFVPGFWNRLHPMGSHPGLSDEEDSTFRLNLVIVVAWHYLKLLDHRI